MKRLLVCSFGLLVAAHSLAFAADKPKDPVLLDASDPAQISEISAEKAEAAAVDAGGGKMVLQGTFPTGEDYPTLGIKAPGGSWDLSAYEGVEVEVTNKGNVSAHVAMRVDNDGNWQDSPWSTEAVTVEPGDTKTLQVKFGFSNGGQPSFALNSKEIIAIKLFVVKPQEDLVIEFAELKPFGKN